MKALKRNSLIEKQILSLEKISLETCIKNKRATFPLVTVHIVDMQKIRREVQKMSLKNYLRDFIPLILLTDIVLSI